MRWGAHRLALVVGVVGAAGLAAGAAAATIEASAAAAREGLFGLEVVVGSTCAAPDDDLDLAPPPDTLSGSYEACRSVSLTGLRIVSPGATITAGERILLDEGFSVDPGVPFSAVLDATLWGDFAFVEDHSPFLDVAYHARFEMNPEPLALAETHFLDQLVGYSDDRVAWFRLILSRDTLLGTHVLRLAARLDDGSWVESGAGEEIPLATGWNTVELEWFSGLGDGHLRVSVNGSPAAGLTGLANGLARVDLVRWGAVEGALAGATGSLLLDSFSSWR